jgi:hypothetical protein
VACRHRLTAAATFLRFKENEEKNQIFARDVLY